MSNVDDIELAAAPDEEPLKKQQYTDHVAADTKVEPSMQLEHMETDPPMRETEIHLGRFGTMRFNHVTSIIGMAILWGVAAWCMADPDGALSQLKAWRGKSALHFTWFYVGTRPIFFFFVMYIAFRYGDIRLGSQDSRPEFDNMSYFTMLFAAGIAVGLFFYGVSEPLWHLNSHWYANQEFRTDDEKAMFSMNQTLYHWVRRSSLLFVVVVVTAIDLFVGWLICLT